MHLYKSRELLLQFVVSDISTQYKQSVFGPAWAIFQPLALMVLFSILRSFVGIESEGIPYPIFAYAAIVPWTFFANAINYSAPKIISSRPIIRKIYFPRELLPISSVLRALVDFLLSFLVLFGLMAYYGLFPGASILLVPVLLLIQIGLAVGVGLIISPLAAFRRDIVFVVPLLLQFWMFLCPVIYPLSSVPDRYQFWYLLNPMAGLIESWRTILLVGELPEMRLLTPAILGASVVLFIGYLFFKRLEMKLADVV